MKTTRLLSTLILTVCLGFGSVMAQNAARQVCPEKAEKPYKVNLLRNNVWKHRLSVWENN